MSNIITATRRGYTATANLGTYEVEIVDSGGRHIGTGEWKDGGIVCPVVLGGANPSGSPEAQKESLRVYEELDVALCLLGLHRFLRIAVESVLESAPLGKA